MSLPFSAKTRNDDWHNLTLRGERKHSTINFHAAPLNSRAVCTIFIPGQLHICQTIYILKTVRMHCDDRGIIVLFFSVCLTSRCYLDMVGGGGGRRGVQMR